MSAGTRGQSTVEMAVMLGAVVAALVATHVYVRRAYQGYLYANASAHGQQFDPTRPYVMTQSMNKFTQRQTVDIEKVGPGVSLPGGSEGLPSVPGGELAGGAIKTTIHVETDWDVSREASYDARH